VILTFDKKCRFEDYDSIYQDFLRNVDFSRYPEYVPENGGQIAGMKIPFFEHVEDYFWEIIVSKETLSVPLPLVSFNHFKRYLLF
jgi:hypothetical protein